MQDQAHFLERLVYDGLRLGGERVLEVGCGVGAQSRALLQRFAGITLEGIDISSEQIERARVLVTSKRANFRNADICSLNEHHTFDVAFYCWVLEHVIDPDLALRKTKQALKPGGRVILTEVQNSSFYCSLELPALTTFYRKFNARQVQLGGWPNIGATLGQRLFAAGFKDVSVEPRLALFDDREPEVRERFAGYWAELMHSAAPALRSDGSVSDDLIAQMHRDCRRLAEARCVVSYVAIRAMGVA